MAARGGLGSLSVFLGLDTTEFNDGLSKAEQQAKRFAEQTASIAAGTAFGQIIYDAAKQAAVGLKDMVFGSIDAADHLNDLSKKTGVAVDVLGGIGFAAGQAGGDLESASAATGKLNKSLAEAASGNKEAAEAFKVLGVGVKDALGQTRSADAVLVDLANKFAEFNDGPEKSALALRIFGKAGADIIPLLDDGGAALQQNIEYFKRYSGVTAETAAAADQFNDTLGKINLLSKAAGTTLASSLLPSFQSIADEFLRMKENGDGFKSAAEAIKVVFDTLVVAAANVAFVFLGVGREIGAVAAQLNALAHGDLDGFTAIGDAVKEDGKRARAELDAFVDRYKNAGKQAAAGVDPADFAVLDQVAGGKKNAPRLAAAGASDGSDELKKQLDSQIKLVQDFAKAQADAFQLGNTYLTGVYADGLVSQRQFFDTQKQVRDAALASQLEAIDKEIALQQAFAASPAAKQADRIAAEGKVTLLVQQRAEAVTKASGVEILAQQANARAAEDLADRYDNLRASVLAASGDDVGAAALKNAQQVRDAARLIAQAQGDPAVAQRLGLQLTQQAQAAELQKQYAKLLDDTARKEAEIYLDAQVGGKGELETLAAIRDARAAAIVQLQQQGTAAAALAAASGSDADIKRADDLALALKKAAAEIDPLATKFNSLFEDSFSNAFAGFLDGTKSAKDAFKDFANSVIGEIARIAAKNLAKSIFGDTGGASGLGGFLSKLFGGSSSSGGTGFGTGSNFGNQDYGAFLATGTNYVPYDGFKATLHKGESVVPAKYNPAAGGRSSNGAPSIVVEDHNGSRVTAQPQDDGTLRLVIKAASDAAYARGLEDLQSGTGAYSDALRNRHGVGPGNLPKRK